MGEAIITRRGGGGSAGGGKWASYTGAIDYPICAFDGKHFYYRNGANCQKIDLSGTVVSSGTIPTTTTANNTSYGYNKYGAVALYSKPLSSNTNSSDGGTAYLYDETFTLTNTVNVTYGARAQSKGNVHAVRLADCFLLVAGNSGAYGSARLESVDLNGTLTKHEWPSRLQYTAGWHTFMLHDHRTEQLLMKVSSTSNFSASENSVLIDTKNKTVLNNSNITLMELCFRLYSI